MQLVVATPTQKAMQFNDTVQRFFKPAVILAFLLALVILMVSGVEANTGAEFKDSSKKVSDWVTGNLGKTIAFGGIIVGLAVFAWTRDFKAMALPIIGALMVGIIVGIVNASFGALI